MVVVPVFSPVSPQAKELVNLFVVVSALCGAILLIVTGIITYSLVWCRGRPGAPEPRQATGHTAIEIIWTVVPLLLVMWLFAMTFQTVRHIYPAAREKPPDLLVIGHRWWWEARYPSTGAVAANEIHIPVGRRLLMRLDSADVIHDFWAPRLGRKMDMVPGHPNEMWLEADQPDTYEGVCDEYCGTQHAWMRFTVVADPPAEFEAWQRRQLQPLPAPASAVARRGAQIFQQTTCISCHAIRGTTAKGVAGPDLTHLAERRRLAAGVLPNTPANLAVWLSNPQAVKPGCLMPNQHLSPDEVSALVRYLVPRPAKAPTQASLNP